MIIFYKEKIYFETVLSDVFSVSLQLKDLIFKDYYVIPLTVKYLQYLNQEIKDISTVKITKDAEHICILVNQNQEIFLIVKFEDCIYKIQIHKSSNFLIDYHTLISEKIFIVNLDLYLTENFSIENVVKHIFKKTVYQSKPFKAYIASLENLSNKSYTLFEEFKVEDSVVKNYTLTELSKLNV